MVEERFSELADNHGELIKSSLENFTLRVVQTQAILFLKSMSERDGSDM